jgi:hypothetical protein
MDRLRPRVLLGLALIALLAVACSGAASPVLSDVGNSADDRNGDAQAPGEDPAGGPITTQQPGTNQQVDRQLIVYTGSLDLEVAELRPAIERADQVITGLGGHVAASSVSDSVDGQLGRVTYRIPADRWAEALAGLRAIGTRVIDESTESEDVTAQFVDLEARITNLRATEAALQAIMDRAATIDDVLEVQRELTEVRSDIESLTAQRDLLANRAALATLEVAFEVPGAATSRVSEGWDLGREIDNALATLVRLGQLLLSFVIWLVIVVAPIVVPVAIVLYLAVRLRRRWLATRPREEVLAPVPPSVPPPGPWTPDA